MNFLNMKSKIDWHKDPLSLDTIMTEDFKTTQNVRRFFQLQLGMKITFNRDFRSWLSSNTGKALSAAIAEYKRSI